MDSPFISSAARKNRHKIAGIMRRAGGIEYPYEFWHYNR
jgi:D-alanyl-D-alanine dipeptidase